MIKFVALASVAFLVPAAAFAQPKESALAPQKQDGRYVVVVSPWEQGDAMLVDTATGRVWKQVQYDYLKGSPVVWQIMLRVDNEEQRQALIASTGRAERSTPPKP
jgi:hypothetical protein